MKQLKISAVFMRGGSISNRRIVAWDEETVRFRYKDYREDGEAGGKKQPPKLWSTANDQKAIKSKWRYAQSSKLGICISEKYVANQIRIQNKKVDSNSRCSRVPECLLV